MQKCLIGVRFWGDNKKNRDLDFKARTDQTTILLNFQAGAIC